MIQLSGLDSMFLYMETPNAPMHIGGINLIDLSTTKEPLTFERFKAFIGSRVHRVPTFRQKLVNVPLDLDFPYWINDPDFDLDFHVRHVAVPPPGNLQQLSDLVSWLFALPLDRSRPLWEIYFVEGLGEIEGMGKNLAAVVSKIHHAAVDGASGAEIASVILDPTPEPPPAEPPPPWQPDHIPGNLELLARTSSSYLRKPLRLVEMLPQTLYSMVHVGKHYVKRDLNPPPAPFSAPKTLLNGPISPHRRFAAIPLPLEKFKAARKAVEGATLNDVVLCVCSGALRRYLDDHRDLPAKSLVAMCPISVRSQEQKGAMGNQVAAMLCSLATDVENPIERLRKINENTQQSKAVHQAVGAKTLMDWSSFVTPALGAQAARLYTRMKIADLHNPPYNLVITNVPGPQVPLYIAGARVLGNWGTAPVLDSLGLIIVIFSYNGSLDFGLTACSDLMPDVWKFALYLRDSLDELLEVMPKPTAPPPKPKASKAKPSEKLS